MLDLLINPNFPPLTSFTSDLRQVPDTQEVFLSPNSDVSLILEILQRVNEQDGQEAVKLR